MRLRTDNRIKIYNYLLHKKISEKSQIINQLFLQILKVEKKEDLYSIKKSDY